MFDYDAPSVPDMAVADVVVAIVNHGKPPPLSEEERNQRWLDNQLWLEECRQRDEQRRIAYQQEQAAKTEQEQAEHRKQEAIRQRERQERINREVRDRELASLRLQSARQAAWQHNVEQAARNAVAQQQRESIMADLEAMINPPQPPPEPESEVIYLNEDERGSPHLGDPDFNPKLWTKFWR